MDEEETQKSLIHHENEKRYEQLKERSDSLKQEIAQVMIQRQMSLETHDRHQGVYFLRTSCNFQTPNSLDSDLPS